MGNETSLLIIGTQQLLYAAGWLLASYLIPQIREVSFRWAAFAIVAGLYFFLSVVEFQAETRLISYLSVFVLVFSVVMARRASEFFFSIPPRWKEDVPLLGILILVLIGIYHLPDEQDRLQWLLSTACIAVAIWILRAVFTVHRAMTQEYGSGISLIIHAPSVLIATLLIVQSALLHTSTSFIVDIKTGPYSGIAYLLLMLTATGFIHVFYVILIVKRLVQQLEMQAIIDPMTELINRRGIQNILEHNHKLHHRYQEAFSAIMIDIDHFKAINDNYGHGRGDQVLKKIARLLRESVRATDHVARIGGEEFLVILPRTSLVQGCEMAERLRTRIEAETHDILGLPLTISIGVTQSLPHDRHHDRLLIRADRALYKSKMNGRNRVTVVLSESH